MFYNVGNCKDVSFTRSRHLLACARADRAGKGAGCGLVRVPQFDPQCFSLPGQRSFKRLVCKRTHGCSSQADGTFDAATDDPACGPSKHRKALFPRPERFGKAPRRPDDSCASPQRAPTTAKAPGQKWTAAHSGEPPHSGVLQRLLS